MNNKTIYCVLTCDKKYIHPTAVTIYSLIKQFNPLLKLTCFVYCVEFNTKPEIFSLIESKYKNLTITCLPTEKYAEYFPKQLLHKNRNNWISLSAYYRLLMFKFLPKYVDKAVYLDSDLIVNTDLSLLCENFPSNQMFCAVRDPAVILNKKTSFKYLLTMPEFSKYKENDNKYAYFNSGFFTCNLKLCHQNLVFDKLIDFLKKYPSPPLVDQDPLNAVFSQQYYNLMHYLPIEYNVFADLNYHLLYRKNAPYSKTEINDAYQNPKIIHFAGKNKPWLNNKTKYFHQIWRNCAEELNVKYSVKDLPKIILFFRKIILFIVDFILMPPGSYRRIVIKKILRINGHKYES